MAVIYLITIALWNETVAAGVIGATGGVVGGALTLFGVKWTIDKQKWDRFLDTSQIQIVNLSEMSTLLSDFINEFSELGNLAPDQHEKRRIVENSIRDRARKIYLLAMNSHSEIFKEVIKLEKEIITEVRNGYYNCESEDSGIKKRIKNCSELVDKRKEELTVLYNSILNNTKAP